MAYHGFGGFLDLIKYYTNTGNGTLIKEENTTIGHHTLLNDLTNFMYPTQPNFSEDTPNQILHMLSTLILWSKNSYTKIGHYPTLDDFLIEYSLVYNNKHVKPNIFQPTVLTAPCMSGHHPLICQNQGRCHAISMIQVNPQRCPSVILSVA